MSGIQDLASSQAQGGVTFGGTNANPVTGGTAARPMTAEEFWHAITFGTPAEKKAAELSLKAGMVTGSKKKKGLFQSIGDFIGDVGKSIAYVVAAPINSITGHDYDPEYKTGLGKALGGVTENSVDNVHVLGKSFADGISGGAATKLANEFRKDENKESPFQYLEMEKKDTGVDFLDKATGALTKTSAVIGKLYGEKNAEAFQEKAGPILDVINGADGTDEGVIVAEYPTHSNGGFLVFGLLAVLVVLILK